MISTGPTLGQQKFDSTSSLDFSATNESALSRQNVLNPSRSPVHAESTSTWSTIDCGSPLRDIVTFGALLLADVGVLVVCVGLVGLAFVSVWGAEGHLSISRQLLAVIGVASVLNPLFGLCSSYALHPVKELRKSFLTISSTFALVLFANTIFGELGLLEACVILFSAVVALIVGPPARLLFRKLFSRFSWWGQTVLVIGRGSHADEITRYLMQNPELGFRSVARANTGRILRHDSAHSEASAGRKPVSKRNRSSGGSSAPAWAIVAIEQADELTLREELTAATATIPNVLVVPEANGLPTLWSTSEDLAGFTGMRIKERLSLPLHRFTKRAMDLALVIAAIPLLVPIFGVVIGMIKLFSPGPAFFGHRRIGKHGKHFTTWKFRTMVPNAQQRLQDVLDSDPAMREEWERDHKLKNDPRIVPVIGPLLRKFSIDELAQLWNVLRGEMSLVGPRPIVDEEIQKYGPVFEQYLRVTPGITGLWQISGRNNTTYEERLQFDQYYVRNWSPWLDLYILYRTVKTVVFREGAF